MFSILERDKTIFMNKNRDHARLAQHRTLRRLTENLYCFNVFLHSIHRLVFLMKAHGFLCQVRTAYVYTMKLLLVFKIFNKVKTALYLGAPRRRKGSGYTGCNRRNGPDFGRVFLRAYYTDITQNTYIQSSMVTEILAREV